MNGIITGLSDRKKSGFTGDIDGNINGISMENQLFHENQTKHDSLDWCSWENRNRKPMGFYHQIDRGFRFRFSHHPIL